MPKRGTPRSGDVLSSLPATRPQRRSARRAPAADSGAAATPRTPRKAGPGGSAKGTPAARSSGKGRAKGTPAVKSSGRGRAKAPTDTPAAVRPSVATHRARQPGPRPRSATDQGRQPEQARSLEGMELVNTTVQAAGELAQIGLSLSARALRGAVSRLPRP